MELLVFSFRVLVLCQRLVIKARDLFRFLDQLFFYAIFVDIESLQLLWEQVVFKVQSVSSCEPKLFHLPSYMLILHKASSVGRHVNSGGRGGHHAPPMSGKYYLSWKITHFTWNWLTLHLARQTRNVGPANLSWKAKDYTSN